MISLPVFVVLFAFFGLARSSHDRILLVGRVSERGRGKSILSSYSVAAILVLGIHAARPVSAV